MREAADDLPAGRVGERREDGVDGHPHTQTSAAARASAIIVPVARGRQCSGTPATSSGTSGRSSTITRVPPGASSSVHSTRDGTPVASSSQRKRSAAPVLDLLDDALARLAASPRRAQRRALLGLELDLVGEPLAQLAGSVSSAQARSRSTGRTISRRTVDTDWASCNSSVAHRLACATQRLHYTEVAMPLVPMVIQQDARGERSFDIYSRLLNERVVFLGSAVDDEVANLVNAQLLHLEAADPEKEIQLYINCPGGVVYAGLSIYDTMRFIKPDVRTICCGIAMSMGSLILAGGAPGKRQALPNSRILIHQPTGGFQGQTTRHRDPRPGVAFLRRRLEEIYSEHTGRRSRSCAATWSATASSRPRRPSTTA